MTRLRAIGILLLICNFSFASKRIEFSHPMRKLTNSRREQSISVTPRDTVRILAIMVEFQIDNDDQTTGNGKFQSEFSTLSQIDPPPHDSLYFTNKIKFVGNYFHKVSNGKLSITGSVYGSSRKITLSKPMKSYAPPTNINDNKNLADLAEESWQIADSLYPEIDFQKFDAFVIFHAGAGRDIDLISSLGVNPTPYDIPSLYLDSTAFALALGQPSFAGFVNGKVKNTVILPETETRDIQGSSGTITYQLSINGMFAASIGSYLGLPDLFNTNTGRSGIGQFGLMDGASIFAYSGLFPPEPCAWEKIYLGWLTPITIGNSALNVSVPAVGLKYPMKQDSIYKIPISSAEYFLIENRNRNPKGTGLDIKLADAHGDTLWRHFNQDTSGFDYSNDSLISGSVVDVSNFDWALIGETDGTGKSSPFDGGGILIWHIDESVIHAGLNTNSVNVNLDHRGVDLEEADGSKDIGQNYVEFSDAGYGTENGSPLDCWFDGNSAARYSYSFDQNSFPNSNSFSGAASLVTIKNFSARSPHMTMAVEIGSSILRRDSVLTRTFVQSSEYPTSTKNHHLYVPANDSIFALQSNGRSLTNNASAILSDKKSSYGVAVYQQSSSEIAASVQDSTLIIFQLTSPNNQGAYDSLQRYTQTIHQEFTTSPCFAARNIAMTILVGTYSGKVCEFNLNGDLISQQSVANAPITSLALLPTPSLSQPDEYFCIAGDRIYSQHDSTSLPASSKSWVLAGAVSPNSNNFIVAAEKNGNKIVSYNQSLSQKNFEIIVSGSGIDELAIADIDGDGEKDIIIQSANNLSVINRIGAMLDGFPIQARAGMEFTGTPLAVDFDGDSKQEIVLFTDDGEMWVYHRNGKLVSGFPIQTTTSGKTFPAVYVSSSDKLGIATISESGSFDAFLSSSSVTPASLMWWQHLCDERHGNVDASIATLIPISTEFFPKSRVYNWPNPVYGQSTQIRYYTSEDANVTITILDLSGKKITQLNGRGTAGMDSGQC